MPRPARSPRTRTSGSGPRDASGSRTVCASCRWRARGSDPDGPRRRGDILSPGGNGGRPMSASREGTMDLTKIIRGARRLSRPYRVDDGKTFRLKDFDPGDTGALVAEDKPRAREALQSGVEALASLQDILYAQDRWAVLLVFQAMDAAGKDGAIKHVMSGVNPQGCQVASFKSPSAEDLDHDYMWRCQKELPERGRIGICNRSYYEEVLVVRVHPELLAKQKIPPDLAGHDIWKRRYKDIRG